jgi:hypothetical protein
LRTVKKLRKPSRRTFTIAVAGVAVAVVAILVISSLGGEEASTGKPDILSESELLERVGELEGPVYWAGPRPGAAGYELTVAGDGSILLHYLAEGATEDQRPELLTIGTYPVADAQNALLEAKNAGRGLTISEHEGYQVLEGAPHNVYVVFYSQPGLQIELYSPEPGEADRLAQSAALTPVGG